MVLHSASRRPKRFQPGTNGESPCSTRFLSLDRSVESAWIEELYARGITGGYGAGIYCPSSPNTRGQMAVFLVKTFGLLLYGP